MIKVNVIGRWVRVRPMTDAEKAARYTATGDRQAVLNAGCEFRYQVEVLVYEQENWYPLTHAARFKDKARAEACADKIRAAIRQSELNWNEYVVNGGDMMKPCPKNCREDGVPKFMGLDLRNWTYFYGITVPFTQLQPKPTAVEYDVN